jgi:hypothetical protein
MAIQRIVRVIVQVLAGLLSAASPALSLAQDASDDRPRDVVMRSVGPESGSSLASAVRDLYRRGNLAQERVYLGTSARTPFQALVHKRSWPVEFDHVEFEELLCVMNPAVCVASIRSGVRTSTKKSSAAVKQFCDAHASKCRYRWRIRRDDDAIDTNGNCATDSQRPLTSLCVPRFNANEFTASQVAPLLISSSLHILADQYLKCPLRNAWKIESLAHCRRRSSKEILDILNGGSYSTFARAFGKATIPTIGIAVDFGVADRDASIRAQSTVQKAIQKSHVLAPFAPAIATFDIQRLRDGFLRVQGSTSNPHSQESTPETESTPNYEPDSLAAFKNLHWTALPQLSQLKHLARIVVIEPSSFAEANSELHGIPVLTSKALNDQDFNSTHGNGKDSIECPRTQSSAYTAPQVIVAQSLADSVPDATDEDPDFASHGAAVMGVLAAVRNKKLAMGALPVSDLPQRTIWYVRSSADEYAGGAPVDAFLKGCDASQSSLIIVNYSSTAENGDSRQEASIDIDAAPSSELFVVPTRDIKNSEGRPGTTDAGASTSTSNTGGSATQPNQTTIETPAHCQLSYPACDARGKPNVISVGSLLADGRTVSSASIHGLAHEVAAIGDVSTISAGPNPHRILGHGSSYAVPYVSALASLIFDYYKAAGGQGNITAADLKVRILATAELTRKPEESFAFGPINYGRALELKSDHLDYALGNDACDDTATNAVDGQIVDTGDFASTTAHEVYGGGTKTVFPTESILRIRRDCSNTKAHPEFDVIVRIAAPNTKSTLPLALAVRYTHVDLQQREVQLKTVGGVTPVSLARLRDYVACMRPFWPPTSGCLGRAVPVKRSTSK